MCAWEWFPDHNGLVSGILFSAFGFSAFFWGFLTTYLINPDNVMPAVPEDGSGTQDKLFPEDVANNFPHCFTILAIIFATLALIGVMGVSRNPDYVRSEKIRKRSELMGQNNSLQNHVNFVTVNEALKSAPFWLMSLMFFNGLFFCVYNSSVYKNNATDDISDHLLTVAGAVGAICNGGSSFMWGTALDKFGFKLIYGITIVMEIVVAFTIYFVRDHASLYIIFVAFAFLC